MKKFRFLLLFCYFSIYVLASCSLPDGDSKPSQSLISDDNMIISDDWDWTIDKTYTLWSRVDNGEIFEIKSVRLPWFTSDGGPASNTFNYNRDFLKEDGWVLLSRNFGERDSTQIVLCPYFILYNRARGLMRVFYYYPGNESFSYASMELTCNDGVSTKSASFAFSKNGYSSVDNYSYYGSNKSDWNGMTSIHEIQKNSWNYAEFFLSYDPEITDDTTFVFILRGYLNSTITMNGNMFLEAKNTKSTTTLDIFSRLGNGISSAVSYYSSGEKLNQFLIDNGFYESLNTSSSVNSRASYSNNRAINWVGAAFAAVGFVTSMLQSSRMQSSTMVGYDGNISLSGDINQPHMLFSVKMKIPGARATSSFRNITVPSYDYPLGVFALSKNPRVLYYSDSIKAVFHDRHSSYSSGILTQIEYKIKLKGLREPIVVVFNDIPGYSIESVEAGFCWRDKDKVKIAPVIFMPLSEFNHQYYNNHTIIDLNGIFCNGNRFSEKFSPYKVIDGKKGDDIDGVMKKQRAIRKYYKDYYIKSGIDPELVTCRNIIQKDFITYFPSIAIKVVVGKDSDPEQKETIIKVFDVNFVKE